MVLSRIDTPGDVLAGLDALCRADPRLPLVRSRCGEVPLRRMAPGFASLVSIIVSQQVSRASAEAMYERLRVLMDPLTPDAVLQADDGLFREAGLSRAKQRTLVAVSLAIANGTLSLERLDGLEASDAISRLVTIAGIGEWTAQVYLLFALGHADLFPSRDVALQSAVAAAFELDARPGERELAIIAESWAPWRGVAARLFWAYYKAELGREGLVGLR